MKSSRSHSRAWWIVVSATVVLGLLLALQTPWGLTRTLSFVLRDTGVSLQRARGAGLSRMEVHGLSYHGPGARLRVDTIRVRYNMFALVRGTVHLRNLSVAGMDLTIMPASPDTAAATEGGAIQVDDLLINRSHVSLPWEPDTMLHMKINSLAGEAAIGPQPAVRLHTTDIVAVAGREPLRITGKLAMEDNLFHADSVQIRSSRTRVTLHGYCSVPAPESLPKASLALHAAPVDLGDVSLITGLAMADGPVMLRGRVTDESGAYRLMGAGAGPGGGSLTFDVAVEVGSAYDAHMVAVRDLGLSVLDSSLVGRLSMDLSGHVTGADVREFSGDVHLLLQRSTWEGLESAGGEVRVRLADGTADVAMDLELGGAQVGFTGAVDYLGQAVRYSAQGFFTDLDLMRFGGTVRSDLSGTMQVTGHGTGRAVAKVRMGPGALGEVPLARAAIDAQLQDVHLEVAASAEADTGLLAATASWVRTDTGDAVRGTVRMEQFDAAGALNLGVTSEVSGEVAVHLQGVWPPDAGDIAVGLRNSRLGGTAFNDLRLQAALGGALAAFEGYADLAAGQVTISGTARPFDVVPTYAVTEIAFDSLDAGMWVPGWYTMLQGVAQLTGQGANQLAMKVAFGPSQLNSQRVDTGTVEVQLRGSEAAAAVGLGMPDGALAAAITGSLTESVFRANGTFQNLDLGALLGVEGFRTALSGAVDTLLFTGPEPAQMALAAEVRLDTSRVNEQAIHDGWLHLQADSGFFSARSAARWEGGDLRIDTFSGRWLDPVPSYHMQASVEALDLEAWAGIPAAVTGAVSLTGKGRTPETMVLERTHLTARNSRYQGIAVHDFAADLEWADGLLQVDTFLLSSNALHVRGGGGLVLTPGLAETQTFALRGRVADALPLAALFSDAPVSNEPSPADTLWMTARSAGDSITFEGRAQLSGISAGAARVLDAAVGAKGSVRADGTGQYALGLDSAWADLQRVSVPGLSARNASAHARLEDDILAFQARVAVDAARRAATTGTVDVAGRQVKLQQLDVHLGRERWHLDQEAEFTFGDGYRVRNFLLVERDQEIALDGVIDPNGSQSLALTLFNVRPGSVADLLGLPGLGGVVNGDLLLTGDARAPELDGSITMSLEASGAPVGVLDATMEYAHGRMNLDARMAHIDRSTLTLTGHYPAHISLNRSVSPAVTSDQVALEATADRFNVGWISPFMDPKAVSAVAGRLTGNVLIGGTTRRPELLGSFLLEEGLLGLPALGVTAEEVEARARFEGDAVTVEHISARSGGGTLEGGGTIGMSALTLGAYDLTGTADRFRVVDNEAYLGHVTGEVRLQGTTEFPRLAGSLRLTNADIRPAAAADQVYGPVAFTPDDVRMLERYFNIRVSDQDTTTFLFYDALAMDLSLVVGEDVWLRSRASPEMNIPFQGVLDITKVPGAEQQVFGTVQVEPAQSYVRQFGRRFDIDTGRLTFTGPALNPLIDLRASYDVPARNSQDSPVTIYLDVDGSVLDEGALQLRLSSDPAILDESDIISYIATGRPAAEAFQMAEENTLQVGRDIAVNQLTNLIAGAAGAELGLDVVEIEQQGSKGVTLTAGKRISRDLYASISWPIAIGTGTLSSTGTLSENSKQVIIEYSLFTWLLGRLRGDTESLGASVVVQYAY